jgi:fatty-acyl-CoA synthase
VPAIPLTPTMKPVRRDLRREAWACPDPVWWRPSSRDRDFRRLTADDVDELHAEFVRRGRQALGPSR